MRPLRCWLPPLVAPLLGCGAPDWRAQLDVDVIAQPEQVIVVGAGMAGLAAAKALHLDSREVIVLEARDRVGGRTVTEEVGDATVDLGAAWIHGPRDNPVALLLDGYDLAYARDRAGGGTPLVRDASGERFSGAQLAAASRFFSRSMNELDWALDDLGGDDASMAEVLSWSLDDRELTGWKRELREFAGLRVAVELDYAAPADDISAAASWEVATFAGGDHLPAGGFGRLVDALADGLDVRLDAAVTAIDWSDEVVRVETADATYETTHVVLTVPLWVLQSEQIAFTPALPDDRLALLERVAMADLEKVVLTFDEDFWSEEAGTLLFIDGTPGRYPACGDFTVNTGVPTLVCFTGGAFSEEDRATESDDDVIAGTLQNLGRALDRDDLPPPTASHVTRWSSDPWTAGSYSYVRVGGSLDDLLALGEPLGDRVLFAGEHTAGTFHQTVHGAVISGLREAARLGADPYALPGLEH